MRGYGQKTPRGMKWFILITVLILLLIELSPEEVWEFIFLLWIFN